MQNNRKQMVTDLLKSIETGAAAPIAYIHPQHYIQHNPAVATGLDGFRELLQQLEPGSARVNTVRVLQDDDYVVAHSDYQFFGPKVGFDIFRFDGDTICEHWDNLQARPALHNPSGHSMTDGSADITDLDQTAANKELVGNFVHTILVQGKMEELGHYFDGDYYIQHNPGIGDGVSGLGQALADWAQHGVTMQYQRVHKILGEGNFVLAVSEGYMDKIHCAFYDLFRIQNGRIAEHWDTIEYIPPVAERRNSHGKF